MAGQPTCAGGAGWHGGGCGPKATRAPRAPCPGSRWSAGEGWRRAAGRRRRLVAGTVGRRSPSRPRSASGAFPPPQPDPRLRLLRRRGSLPPKAISSAKRTRVTRIATRGDLRPPACRAPCRMPRPRASRGGRIPLLLPGGLTAADTSIERHRRVDADRDAPARRTAHRGSRRGGRNPARGHLPVRRRRWDRQHADIVRVDPVSVNDARGPSPGAELRPGRRQDRGQRLRRREATPDAWLDTIVAWRPGSRPRRRAPAFPAALCRGTAVGGRLVIAGGSRPQAPRPTPCSPTRPWRTRRRPSGGCPAPTTHGPPTLGPART